MAACVRLSGFALPIKLLLVAPERLREVPEIATALDLAETPLGFQVGGRSPAFDHVAITLAAHAARDAPERSIGVLDDVGSDQAANQRRDDP